jgi:hypothetical protein
MARVADLACAAGRGRSTPFTRTIEQAMQNVGDAQRLADLLKADIKDLKRWMLGHESPPPEVFLRALDLAFRHALPLCSAPGSQRDKGLRLKID